MASETYFIAKSDVSDVDLISIDGTPVVENYEAIRIALSHLANPDVADLFAEPVYRRGNDQAPAVISWYASLPDDARQLDALDDEERKVVEDRLRRKLVDVAEALKDPQMGPLVGAVLHSLGKADIYALGDRPVIVNWGMVPSNVGLAPAARRQHFASTLGRFLPQDEAPPITADEHSAMFPHAQSEEIEAAAAPFATSNPQNQDSIALEANSGAEDEAPAQPDISSPVHSANNVVRVRSTSLGWRWLPLITLLVVTAIVILLLNIPGVLLYPPDTALNNEESTRIAQETNESLRKRRDALRQALEGAVCRGNGEIDFPNTPFPSRPGGSPDGVASGDEKIGTDDLLPPPPERIQVPANDGDATNLPAYIEDRTAMVLVGFKQGSGSGTGFFVGPDLLVTNDHVVHGSRKKQKRRGAPQVIFVKSARLGKGLPAELVASSGQSKGVGPDFALLRVPGANAKFFPLWGATASIKLQNVIAAGFPGAYFKIDQARGEMYDPNSPTMPDMIMTQGTINAQQKVGQGGTLSVVHSADISPGNSGGPLVDQCGRVVGVNTFGIQDESTKRYLNFSLHTTELLKFLSGAGAKAQSLTETCRPQISKLPPVAREAPPQEADDKPADRELPPAPPPPTKSGN